jgi:hypothetical protein
VPFNCRLIQRRESLVSRKKKVVSSEELIEKQDAEDAADAKKSLLEQDIQNEIFSGPAVFANRIFVTITPLGVRLTFTEQQEDAPVVFRTAAYLNILDAFAFKDLLNRQLGKLAEAVEDAETPPEGGE